MGTWGIGEVMIWDSPWGPMKAKVVRRNLDCQRIFIEYYGPKGRQNRWIDMFELSPIKLTPERNVEKKKFWNERDK